MQIIKLDLKSASISIDSEIIEVNKNGELSDSIKRLSQPTIEKNRTRVRYHLLRKVSVCGNSAEGVIEINEGKLLSATFLFDFIEFFESSILESKIIKTCEKSWNMKFASTHPSTAFLENCEWGSATFFYDAKQGDLSLELKFDSQTRNTNDISKT